MKILKGKKEYPILNGDYLLFNGAAWMFHPKDNSIFQFEKWHRPAFIFPSQKEVKRVLVEYPNKKIKKNRMDYYLF